LKRAKYLQKIKLNEERTSEFEKWIQKMSNQNVIIGPTLMLKILVIRFAKRCGKSYDTY
jgi:hypothetical protein